MIGQVNNKKDDDEVRKRKIQSAYNTYGPVGRGVTKAALGVKDIGRSFKGSGVPLANKITAPLDSYKPNSTAGFESNPNSTSLGDIARGAGNIVKSGARRVADAVRQGPTPGPSLDQALTTTPTSDPSRATINTPDPSRAGLNVADPSRATNVFDTGVQQTPRLIGQYSEPTSDPAQASQPTQALAGLSVADQMKQDFLSGPTYRGASFADRGFGPGSGRVAGGFGSRGLSTSSGPQAIAAPRSIGDMLRYNRQSKEQRDAAAMEDASNKTGIAAFSAQQQAEDDSAKNDLASRRLGVLGQHYARSDRATDIRNNQLGEAEANRNNIAQGNLDSLTGLREEQALTASEKRTGSVAQRDALEAEAQSALSNDPTNPALQARVQAFTAPPAAITAAESAKLSQAEMKSYLNFYKGLQGNSLAPLDPEVVMRKFRETQGLLNGQANPVDQYFQ